MHADIDGRLNTHAGEERENERTNERTARRDCFPQASTGRPTGQGLTDRPRPSVICLAPLTHSLARSHALFSFWLPPRVLLIRALASDRFREANEGSKAGPSGAHVTAWLCFCVLSYVRSAQNWSLQVTSYV